MKQNTKRALLRGAAFLMIFLALFAAVNHVFIRKSLVEPWNMTTKIAGFYNEPQNSCDVLFFGSSHAYASFVPAVIEEETGLTSYVFATQKQPIWATYHYMVEAFKRQSPSFVVVEANMLGDDRTYLDEGTNHSYLDDLPMSRNKLDLIWATAPAGERAPYVLPFLKYHARWSELHRSDLTYLRLRQHDPLRGYVRLPDSEAVPVHEDLTDLPSYTLPEKNLGYLAKIRALCEEQGVPLWIVKAPSNPSAVQQAQYNAVERWAQENGVPYLDCCPLTESIGLTDDLFFDQSHLDERGAVIFSRWFAGQLTEQMNKTPIT